MSLYTPLPQETKDGFILQIHGTKDAVVKTGESSQTGL